MGAEALSSAEVLCSLDARWWNVDDLSNRKLENKQEISNENRLLFFQKGFPTLAVALQLSVLNLPVSKKDYIDCLLHMGAWMEKWDKSFLVHKIFPD